VGRKQLFGLADIFQHGEENMITGKFFLNISNHPWGQWSQEQIAAARRIAPVLVDIPFPAVPPEAESHEVERLADRLVADLQAGNLKLPGNSWRFARDAMVQGEHTLTAVLVRRLQDIGITAYAATTERVVAVDNEGRKVSTFRFVKFRPYPLLTMGP